MQDLTQSLEIIGNYKGELGVPALNAEDLELNKKVIQSEIVYFEMEIKQYEEIIKKDFPIAQI